MNQAPSKIDIYRMEVLPPERASELYSAMPSHIKPAVFERNLMNALMANPDLMIYDPRLVYREVAKAAGLGLLLDPILGEAYLVVAYNYKTKQKEPQLRVGYKGMCKLARQSGDVGNIYAHEVHEKDFVEVDLGFPKVFHHKPKLFGDRGPIVGYVALITFDDGTFDFEPMSVAQCHEIRDRSDAWKAFSEGKIKSTPWSTDDVEMSKKTVLRRLLKRQQQSPEMVMAQRIEDEAEHPLMGSHHAAVGPRDSGPPINVIEHVPTEVEEEASEEPPEEVVEEAEEESTEGDGSFESHPPEVEEPYTLSTEKETFGSLAEKYIAKINLTKEPGEVFRWIDKNRLTLDKITEGAPKVYAKIKQAQEQQLVKLRAVASKPAEREKEQSKDDAPKSTRKKKAQPESAASPDDVLANIETVLAAVTDPNDLETVWNTECAEIVDGLMPPDRDEAAGIYRKHERRLS